jgi:hypothetical protein
MRSHLRIYNLPVATTFSFDPIYFDCDLEDTMGVPENGKISTMEVHFGILECGNGKYSYSVSLPVSCGASEGEHGNPIVFWQEGDLTIEQMENDIDAILERKELFI